MEQKAQPIQQERFNLFHNGFVSNYKELAPESGMSDSEVICHLIQEQVKKGLTLNQALKNVCET